MYNRYIPQSDGSFQKNRVGEQRTQQKPNREENIQHNPPPPPPQPDHPHSDSPALRSIGAGSFLKQLLPKNFDTEDLLIVLLLLLMAGDCEDEKSNALLTLALYFFM